MRRFKAVLLTICTIISAPMIFIYTEPNEGNLITAVVLTILCGIGAKHYFNK